MGCNQRSGGGRPPSVIQEAPGLRCGESSRTCLAAEAEIFAGMERDADLLDPAATAIVPEQPRRTVPEHVRLIDGVAIPGRGAGARSDNGIRGQALPTGDAVARARQADARVVPVAEADVRHVIPVAMAKDLGGGHFRLLPGMRRIGDEDRSGPPPPVDAVRAPAG